MLVPNLRPKVVPHSGSRLLLGLIVRPYRRLVARTPLVPCSAKPRSSGSPLRQRGLDAGGSRSVSSVTQRARLLALRLGAPARVYFPTLCSQSQFNRRIRALEPELRALQRAFAEELCEPSAVYRVVDTTLIPAVVRVRACRKGLFASQATFGRSASKTEWVYGFKVWRWRSTPRVSLPPSDWRN